MAKPELLDDEIGRKLAQAEQSGELKSARGYGKPLEPEEGWNQTPPELRMGFKILKDAGVVPPEVELFHRRARLREQLSCAGNDIERTAIAKELCMLEQHIALRLDAIRVSGRV
jgi:hypothetical protein